MAVRASIRTFDSNDYWHQLASKEACLSIAWSSDYSVAQQRAEEDLTGAHLAFTLLKEGSNITYNALLIPASAPHLRAAHQFLNFILDPRTIAEISNDIHYGNDNLAARPFVDSKILSDPAVYPPTRGQGAPLLAGRLGARVRPAAHPGLDAHKDGPIAGAEANRLADQVRERIQQALLAGVVGYGGFAMAKGTVGSESAGSTGNYLTTLASGGILTATRGIAPDSELRLGRSFDRLEEAAAAGGGHQAQVTLTRYGQVIASWWETMNKGDFGGCTEQRALGRVLESVQKSGSWVLELTIFGYHPPCPYGGCMNIMQMGL